MCKPSVAQLSNAKAWGYDAGMKWWERGEGGGMRAEQIPNMSGIKHNNDLVGGRAEEDVNNRLNWFYYDIYNEFVIW